MQEIYDILVVFFNKFSTSSHIFRFEKVPVTHITKTYFWIAFL